MQSKIGLGIIVFLLLAMGCKNGNEQIKIEKLIVEIVNKQCNDNSNCIVAIKKLTKFKWDKMYAFNYPVPLEVINKAINKNYPYYREFTRPLIFLEGDKIVYYENNPSDVENLVDKQVVFDFADTLKYQVYNYDKSDFKVEKKEFEKGSYYELHQVP